MEAEAENELALKLGFCEEHVLELDYTFRAWDKHLEPEKIQEFLERF